MDPGISNLLSLCHNDKNNLPYYITKISADGMVKVPVCFRPSIGLDWFQVQNWPPCGPAGWIPGCSTFRDVWLHYLKPLESPNPSLLALQVTAAPQGAPNPCAPTGDVQGNIPFYEKLGFVSLGGTRLYLDRSDLEALIANYF